MKALCLSGGGSKGAFQVGAIRRLMEDGSDYKIMTGASVGALNIAGLSMTPYGQPGAAEWLENFWRQHVEPDAIYKRWFPFGKLHSLWEKSVYDSRPLHDLVRTHYDKFRISSSGRNLSVGAVCLDTGEHRYVSSTDPKFVDWILASASYPVFFEPIQIDGKLWSDGGVRRVTPIGQAILMGADEIDVVTTYDTDTGPSNWDSSRKAAVPEQVLRVLDLMNSQIMYDDLRVVGLKNELAVLGGNYKHVTIRLIQPSKPLSSGLSFEKHDIARMIDQGYEEAKTITILR